MNLKPLAEGEDALPKMSEWSEVFRHTPYDGSSLPFAVGLTPIGEEDWLEVDGNLVPHLAEKHRLRAVDRAAVFRAEPGTEAAQREVLEMIAGNLARHHRQTHRIDGGRVFLSGTDRWVDLAEQPALLTAACIVQEDLVLMRPGEDGYRLAAASLCFPSSWSLAEKFGRSMSAIHETVPGFNGHRMGLIVARLFENLKVGQLVCRFNWSIHPDGNLHHPEAKRIHIDTTDAAVSQLFLRVERQTLRRLPHSGDILFTIKIHHDPLAALQEHPQRSRLAGDLRAQLMALDADQVTYKGLAQGRERLAAALAEVASGHR